MDKFAIQARNQAIFWLVAFAVFLIFIWLFSDILLPFVAGMALAYFLDPVADKLEASGASRMAATVSILVMFLILFIVGLMVIAPVLGNQLVTFLERMPELVSKLQALITSLDIQWLRNLIGIKDGALQDSVKALMTEGAGWIATVFQQLWSSGKSLVSLMSLFVVTPVVAFYLLYDWDHMVERIDSWLPRAHRETIHEIVGDIDRAVAGFVRGQGTVCLILGVFYAIALTLAGLNFGLLIGLFAGLISFIPYVGSTLGLVLSVAVALVQFWPEWIPVAIVIAIFAIGQFVEGNFLQPKLVGSRVGLHPVWLMFALFAFGSLFGFTGLLVAVPASAAIGVVTRFALGKYMQSDLYRGEQMANRAKREAAKTRRKR